MLIPSTITARRTRRYTSTWYIHPTTHKHDFKPMDGRGRYIFQPPQSQAVNPSRWSTLPPPFTADFYADMMDTLAHAVDRKVVEKTLALQQAAREAGLLVCYSATVFRPGYIEISDRNKTFSQRKRSGQPAVSDPVQLIHPSVKPVEGEVVAGKHRVNALYGTDLDMTLRANDIHTLIILGYATSGVVLSTVRYAADLDYQLN